MRMASMRESRDSDRFLLNTSTITCTAAPRVWHFSAFRITASDDSCVRGGLHGYEATGHAREKPNLPICASEIGDL